MSRMREHPPFRRVWHISTAPPFFGQKRRSTSQYGIRVIYTDWEDGSPVIWYPRNDVTQLLNNVAMDKDLLKAVFPGECVDKHFGANHIDESKMA